MSEIEPYKGVGKWNGCVYDRTDDEIAEALLHGYLDGHIRFESCQIDDVHEFTYFEDGKWKRTLIGPIRFREFFQGGVSVFESHLPLKILNKPHLLTPNDFLPYIRIGRKRWLNGERPE